MLEYLKLYNVKGYILFIIGWLSLVSLSSFNSDRPVFFLVSLTVLLLHGGLQAKIYRKSGYTFRGFTSTGSQKWEAVKVPTSHSENRVNSLPPLVDLCLAVVLTLLMFVLPAYTREFVQVYGLLILLALIQTIHKWLPSNREKPVPPLGHIRTGAI